MAGDDHQRQHLSRIQALGKIFHQLAAPVRLIEERSIHGIERDDRDGARLIF